MKIHQFGPATSDPKDMTGEHVTTAIPRRVPLSTAEVPRLLRRLVAWVFVAAGAALWSVPLYWVDAAYTASPSPLLAGVRLFLVLLTLGVVAIVGGSAVTRWWESRHGQA